MKNDNDQDILDFVKEYEKKNTSSDGAPGKISEVKFTPSTKKQERVHDMDDEFGIDEFMNEKPKIREEVYNPVNKVEEKPAEAAKENSEEIRQEMKEEKEEVKGFVEHKAFEEKKDDKKDDYIDRLYSDENFKDTAKEEKKDIKEDDFEKRLHEMEKEAEKEVKTPFITADFISINDVDGGIDEIEEKLLPKQEVKPVKEKIKVETPPPAPQLSKKEQKRLEKERQKSDKIEKKEREIADKRKWSTYHHGFVLADGEKIVKEYNCLKLVNPQGDGVITVTNKRLLCSTNELTETEIDNITGIKSKYKSKFSFMKLFLFLLLGGIGVACFLAGKGTIDLTSVWTGMPAWFKYILYSVGGIAAFFAFIFVFTIFGREFNITFFTKDSTQFISYTGLSGKIKPNVIRVKPGKESKTIIHEIGAVILEVKAGKYS